MVVKLQAGCNAYRAAIALGSNLGDSCAIVSQALEVIGRSPQIALDVHSSMYETVAVGPPQPDYLNLCALVSTTLTPQALLYTLLTIEAQFGRVRLEKNGPRSLDLDLLLFDDQIIDQANLQIPHPRMHERAFVLVPLAEIAPDWIEPVSGRAIAEILERVDRSGVRMKTEDRKHKDEGNVVC
jgi:2-amino-4-hydroxy-6-hydroxymethyldihydropteridine diphosphokinase